MLLIPLMGAIGASAVGGGVNLHQYGGYTLSQSSGDTTTGFRFKADGTMFVLNREDGGALTETQINTGTDWIIPNAAAALATYHVKAEQDAQSGGGTLSGALSTWIEINADIDWHITRPNPAGNGTSIWDLTFYISDDAGSTTLDTGAFTADAERDV